MSSLRVILELDPEATAIAGSLDTGATRTRFEGLLELVSLLQRVIEPESSDAHPPERSTRVMDANPGGELRRWPRDADRR
jgi:hypothetical protein